MGTGCWRSNPWYNAMLFSLVGICETRLALFLDTLGDRAKLATVEFVTTEVDKEDRPPFGRGRRG